MGTEVPGMSYATAWDATEPPLASIPMKGVEASCRHEYLQRAMGAPDRGVLHQ